MRYVDPAVAETRLPAGWYERSAAAREAVRESDVDHRADEINRHRGVWIEARDPLADASHNKCWYCESRSDRSHFDIDHWRPKGRVYECPDHEGYWWLAFEFGNLRLSCQFCNRAGSEASRSAAGGKADHFPLCNPESRAYAEKDDHNLEAPILLDPTIPFDSRLLWFNEHGDTEVNTAEVNGDPVGRHRAELSIQILNLNENKIRERRVASMLLVKRQYEQAERLEGSNELPARVAFKEAVGEVVRLIRGNAEYSSANRAMVRSLGRGEHSLAEKLLAEV